MRRIPIIDFIRFGSIFLVAGSHFFPRWPLHFIGSATLQKAFSNGPYGVIFFFVVSGFLITGILTKNKADFFDVNLREFYAKRVARILPLFFIVVLISISLDHISGLFNFKAQLYHPWHDQSNFNWLFWLCLFSFNFNWYIIAHQFGDGLQWSVFWSLAIEEQFYLFYPLILKMMRSGKNVFLFLLGVILSGLLFRSGILFYSRLNEFWMPKNQLTNLIQMSSFSNFDAIAFGGVLFLGDRKWGRWFEDRQKLSMGLLLGGTALSLWLCCSTSGYTGNESVYVPTLLALSCALTILGGLHTRVLFSRKAHLLSTPGKLSYGCYLWHPTIMFLLLPVFRALGAILGWLGFLITIVLFAFLSYRYFEAPSNRAIRTLFDLRPSETE